MIDISRTKNPSSQSIRNAKSTRKTMNKLLKGEWTLHYWISASSQGWPNGGHNIQQRDTLKGLPSRLMLTDGSQKSTKFDGNPTLLIPDTRDNACTY